MENYMVVSLSDKKYIPQADLMIQSSGAKDVHYLCLDNETHRHFQDKVTAYSYEEIDSEPLQRHRQTHTWEQHCWALASYFMMWLRHRMQGPLMYVDSDIYFYHPIEAIQVSKSIGIIEHRFKKYDLKRKVGHYNVGIVYFDDSPIGTQCLEWWRNVVMNDKNEFFSEYGTCGDQKYLELFRVFWPNDVEVIDVGHAAPWNTHQEYDGENVTFEGRRQPLVFFHFSHFSKNGTGYKTNRQGEWHPETTWAKELYDKYNALI